MSPTKYLYFLIVPFALLCAYGGFRFAFWVMIHMMLDAIEEGRIDAHDAAKILLALAPKLAVKIRNEAQMRYALLKRAMEKT
jgi:hypothetical protein